MVNAYTLQQKHKTHFELPKNSQCQDHTKLNAKTNIMAARGCDHILCNGDLKIKKAQGT